MMMGLSIYGVAVISGSLYSRFYGYILYTVEPPNKGYLGTGHFVPCLEVGLS